MELIFKTSADAAHIYRYIKCQIIAEVVIISEFEYILYMNSILVMDQYGIQFCHHECRYVCISEHHYVVISL